MAREFEKSSADNEKRKAREERALATEKDRQVRIRSVANDTRLQLPVSIALPDGEEFPGTKLQIRSYDQRAEIQKGYIQGPPNKTICDSSEWINSETGDNRSSREGKNSSKVQLWGLKLSASGKSPPSHSRPRHSNSTNSKNPSSSSPGKHKNSGSSSSSSTCSSTSSSTSSSTGLGGILAPPAKPASSGQSFSEKIHTVLSEKLYQVREGSSSARTSPNNNSSSSGVLPRLIDETKQLAAMSNSKGDRDRGSNGSKQQQQNLSVIGNPNGAGAKLTSVTTSTSTTTTIMTRTFKCDGSVAEPSKRSTLHQSETFSERVQQGGSLVSGTGSGFPFPRLFSKCTSDSDNNGNSGVPPPPCLILGTSPTATANAAATVDTAVDLSLNSMPKTDDCIAQGQEWVTFSAPADRRGLGIGMEINRVNQTGVQNVVNELIPRTTLFSSASNGTDMDYHHQFHLQPYIHPTITQTDSSSSTTSASASPPHFISQRQHGPDQYSLATVDVELLDPRH